MLNQWFDPVVEEVRERGHSYTNHLGNNIHSIMENLIEHQKQNSDKYVSQVTVVKECSDITYQEKIES